MLPYKQTTSKLFFGKWPYKIQCKLPGSWMVKRLGIARTLEFCELPEGHRDTIGMVRSKIERTKLKEFALAISPFSYSDIQTRAEGANYSIYCKDINLFQQIITSLEKWIFVIHEPASEEELSIMSNNAKQVLCNKFPHQRYRYKVYLKHITSFNSRESFATWVKHYNEKIKVTDRTERWFHGRYTQSPYIYVDDQKMLALVGMFLGNNIKKIEEYVVRAETKQ